MVNIFLARISYQHRTEFFELADGNPATYALLLLQVLVPAHALESWKGIVCYDSSLLRLEIPWTIHEALETYLCLRYNFIALPDFLVVKAAIDHALNLGSPALLRCT